MKESLGVSVNTQTICNDTGSHANMRNMSSIIGYGAVEVSIFTRMEGSRRRRGKQNDFVSAASDSLSNLIGWLMDDSSFRHGASRVMEPCPTR